MSHAGDDVTVLYQDENVTASPMCIIQDRHVYDELADDADSVSVQIETLIVIVPRSPGEPYHGVEMPRLDAIFTIGGKKFTVDRQNEQAIQALSEMFTRVALRNCSTVRVSGVTRQL